MSGRGTPRSPIGDSIKARVPTGPGQLESQGKLGKIILLL